MAENHSDGTKPLPASLAPQRDKILEERNSNVWLEQHRNELLDKDGVLAYSSSEFRIS